MNEGFRPQQHPNAAWREVEGEVVVISPEDSVLHELNETASFLWKHATGEFTTEELSLRLADEFEVSEETARTDTRQFVQYLTDKKLLIAALG